MSIAVGYHAVQWAHPTHRSRTGPRLKFGYYLKFPLEVVGRCYDYQKMQKLKSHRQGASITNFKNSALKEGNPAERQNHTTILQCKIGPYLWDFNFSIFWQSWHHIIMICWNFKWYPKSNLGLVLVRCDRIKCQTEFCPHLPFSLRLSALRPPLIPSCPSQRVVTPSLSVHLTPPFNCAAHPNALLKLFRSRGDLRSPFPCLFPECAGCRHCNGLYVLR